MKLTEAELTNLIKESVKKVLKEGFCSDDENNARWEQITDMLGAETIANEVYNYMDCDTLEDFMRHLDRNYDLNMFD